MGNFHSWERVIRAVHGSLFEAVDTFVRILTRPFIIWSSHLRIIYFISFYFNRDQLVTLTTTTPHRQVRIIGITEDHGLLRTIPEQNGLGRLGSTTEYVDLQPDGNSFDLMANLIKSKT